MRLLKFNGVNVDIDEQTAIGIDFQSYDIKDPGKQKLTVSNSFTIPKTSKNLALTGYAGNQHRYSNDIYNRTSVDYYIYSNQLINDGSLRITDVSDRISCFVVQKSNIWDNLALLLWPEFQTEFIEWMQNEKGLPGPLTPFVGTWQDFINTVTDTTDGIILPFTIGTLAYYSADEVNFLEDISKIWIKYQSVSMLKPALGGHFCIYIKTIFEFIEFKYGIDFLTQAVGVAGNIWDDPIASSMYVPARNISVNYSASGFFFTVDFAGEFLPEKNVKDKADKSLLDFTKSVFNYFNILIDRIDNPVIEQYRLARFDDITSADVVDFSGGLTGVNKFAPVIQGYNQQNYITFSKIYSGGNRLVNSKKIICNNKNIDAGSPASSLFNIDAFIPALFKNEGTLVPDLTKSESFSTFSFFVSFGQASVEIKISEESDTVNTATANLYVATTYELESEFQTFANMMLYPEIWTIKKWLQIIDIHKLQFFKRYYVKELNGYFFLNKISGFNPTKSTEATTIEFIKLP